MEISPFLLALLLGWSFVWGVILGALNDANRIIRVFCGEVYSKKHFGKLYDLTLPIVKRPIKRKESGLRKKGLSVLIFFQDIIFFVIAGIGITVLNYEFNEGRFRFFTVFAVVLGFIIYYFTVGKIIMMLSEGIVFIIKATILIIFSAICRPFVIFGRFFAKKLKKIALFLHITIANMQKKLYNINRKKKMMEKSSKGFLKIKNKDQKEVEKYGFR